VKNEEIDKSEQKFKEYHLRFNLLLVSLCHTGDGKTESVG
jgi:hypothetical protein